MNEIEKKVQCIVESIDDFKDSYTYIESFHKSIKIGLDKDFVNIRALSLLYELTRERIQGVIWGDIERLENGFCVHVLLEHPINQYN